MHDLIKLNNTLLKRLKDTEHMGIEIGIQSSKIGFHEVRFEFEYRILRSKYELRSMECAMDKNLVGPTLSI